MPLPTPQLDLWTGPFGDAYVDRNVANESQVRIRVRALAEIFAHLGGEPIHSVLECGCNTGLNIKALKQLTDAELFGVEPNAKARAMALEEGVLDGEHLFGAALPELPFADQAMDLSMTSAVLIHVHPDGLAAACRELARVTRRYLLLMEYFSKQPEKIVYRGQDELLWKRDFGLTMLDSVPGLTPMAAGFFWKPLSGLDDINWWLLRRT